VWVQGLQQPADPALSALLTKILPHAKIAACRASEVPPKRGYRVAHTKGDSLCRPSRAIWTDSATRLPSSQRISRQRPPRLLDLIREFDARAGWNTGFRSCAAWLSWRVGLDLGAARERVRVARALATLPLLARALATAELSYAKVRALTRVATPETEELLLKVGRAGTAAHVERIVRGWRRVDRIAEARETARRHAGRALHVYQDEDGMVTVRGRLEPEVGALLLQALTAARETLYQRARAQNGWTGPRSRQSG
jgi:Domain of unknown function (DUF222)